MKKIWNMVKRISGKQSSPPVKHLKVNGSLIDDHLQICNTLASTLSHNSSTEHYSDQFRHYKAREEKRPLKFESDNTEVYNQPFTRTELQDALHKAHDTAVGPDNIHYQMLKHLSFTALGSLLEIFNNIWLTGNFPSCWSEATIIPLPKPGKDTTSPDNYRSIALTSCICKTFERMVGDRLVWYLEKHRVLTEFQSGFRKQRSTTDQLLRLESFVREAFARREHVVAVFFDLEKAYDTTWKYGILRDLHNAGLRGRMPAFISNFLANRNFRVRLGTNLSDSFKQDMGVPQGSILSVILFILKINSIVQSLPPNIRCSLYVDDFLICYRSRSINLVERQLQRCLNGLQSWADENGFQFSKTKTVCIHFCRQRTLHPDPDLKLYGATVPVVEETKFLGLIFDSKLTFGPHIKYLKDKCVRAMNLLRVVAHTNWGADSETLLKLYRSHIRSKLDYGCIVYGSASPTHIKSLNPVQNTAIRICLGAFRTSPVSSLLVEAYELPLALRRDKLSLQYITKLASTPNNPAYDCVFKSNFKVLFESKPGLTPTLGIRMNQSLLDTGINLNCIAKSSLPTIPPWTIKTPIFIYTLHTIGNKADTPPHGFHAKFNELLSVFEDYMHIYTDGSKDGATVGAAAVTKGQIMVRRLPDHASIFSAEAQAILLALDIANQSAQTKVLIMSDSLSCLQSIENRNHQNPIILQVLTNLHHLLSSGKKIFMMWLPSHIGLTGNSAADAAAKAALRLQPQPSGVFVPYSDFKAVIHAHMLNCWQRTWDDQSSNKLHLVQPKIKQMISYHLPRHDEIVLHRLRIGHSRLTQTYLIKGENQPQCTICNCVLSVEHVLLHCPQHASIRHKYFSVASIFELFEKISPRIIIDFLKDAGIYYKI